MIKTKVPGGAFYAGDGLNVDLVTRTVSAEGGGAQSDYTQNDATASDYIKNRPGGYEVVAMSDIYNATVNGSATGGDADAVYQLLNNTGASCTVILDGVTYENMVVEGEAPNQHIGDASFVNYPFVITAFVDIEHFLFGFTLKVQNSTSSHTLVVQAENKTVIKFEAKYLPNGNIVNGSVDGALTNGKDNTFDSTISNAVIFGNKNTTHIGNSLVVGYGNINNGSTIMAGNGLQGGGIIIFGDHNKVGLNTYQLIVGCGTDDNNRKNSFMSRRDGAIIVPSSTSGSTKYFAITVDDSGTIKAEEVTL